jgi:hypothetical protein
MIDAIVTYAVVACAATFVAWRFFLPARLKLRIRHGLAGTKAPCAPEPESGQCGVGCSGCSLASPRKKA